MEIKVQTILTQRESATSGPCEGRMESWPGGRKAGRYRVMTGKAQGGQNRRQVGDDSIKKEEK